MENGVYGPLVSGECPSGSPLQMRTWYNLAVVVSTYFVEAYLNNDLMVHHSGNFSTSVVKVGVVVFNYRNVKIRFKEFTVVDQDRFETLSNLTDSRPYHLPSFKNSVEEHTILSKVENGGLSSDVYTIAADFRHTEHYSYAVSGTSTGGFGISYNVIDEENFDFVYYR